MTAETVKASKAQKAPKRRSIREDAINLPNMLTMLRVVMIPLVLWLMAEGTPRSNFWAAIVYMLTAVTDFLDGWLARRMGLISILGKFLDPLADKLLVMATLVFMSYMGRLPLLGVAAVILMVGRELSVTALRTIAMSEGVVMAAGSSGKAKTALQMAAILLLILHHPYDVNFFFTTVSVDLGLVGLVILYMSLVMAMLSGGEYLALFVEAVEAKEQRLAEEFVSRGEADFVSVWIGEFADELEFDGYSDDDFAGDHGVIPFSDAEYNVVAEPVPIEALLAGFEGGKKWKTAIAEQCTRQGAFYGTCAVVRMHYRHVPELPGEGPLRFVDCVALKTLKG